MHIHFPFWKHLYLRKFPFFFLKSESNLHFPHPAFGRSGCRLSNSTVIFLPDVSDVWRWPNPVKTLTVSKKKNGNFRRYKCFQCCCKGEKHENKQNCNC
jgi:hypothetical protein